jgi:arginine decarboxylase
MTRPYPPGIPIIAPGELLTTETVDYLQQVAAAGGMVEGASDESLASYESSAIRIVELEGTVSGGA